MKIFNIIQYICKYILALLLSLVNKFAAVVQISSFLPTLPLLFVQKAQKARGGVPLFEKSGAKAFLEKLFLAYPLLSATEELCKLLGSFSL